MTRIIQLVDREIISMECGEHVYTTILLTNHLKRRGASIRPGGWQWFEPCDPIGPLHFVGAEVDRLDSFISFSRTIGSTGEQKGAGLHIDVGQCVMHQIGWSEQSLAVSAAEILPDGRK